MRGVQTRSGLIQEQQLNVAGQGCHQGYLLAVAFGVGPTLHRGIKLETLDETGPPLRVEPAAEPAQEVDHLATGEGGPQRHVAGYVGQPPVQVHRVEPRITTKDTHGTRVGPQEAEQETQRRGLPGSVGSQEPMDLPEGHAQVELAEHLGPAEALDQADNVDDC